LSFLALFGAVVVLISSLEDVFIISEVLEVVKRFWEFFLRNFFQGLRLIPLNSHLDPIPLTLIIISQLSRKSSIFFVKFLTISVPGGKGH